MTDTDHDHHLDERLHRQDRLVGPGHVQPVLVGVAVDDEVDDAAGVAVDAAPAGLVRRVVGKGRDQTRPVVPLESFTSA